jgi:hypothetical protein
MGIEQFQIFAANPTVLKSAAQNQAQGRANGMIHLATQSGDTPQATP